MIMETKEMNLLYYVTYDTSYPLLHGVIKIQQENQFNFLYENLATIDLYYNISKFIFDGKKNKKK